MSHKLYVHTDIEEAAKYYHIPIALWDKEDVYIIQEDRCVFVGKPDNAAKWVDTHEGKPCKSYFPLSSGRSVIPTLTLDTQTKVKLIESYNSVADLQKGIDDWIEKEKPNIIEVKVTLTPMHDLYQSQPPMICNTWISHMSIITYKTNP